jgi:hypothetical protein
MTAVGHDKDMPSQVLFSKYVREHPAFKKQYEKILEDRLRL